MIENHRFEEEACKDAHGNGGEAKLHFVIQNMLGLQTLNLGIEQGLTLFIAILRGVRVSYVLIEIDDVAFGFASAVEFVDEIIPKLLCVDHALTFAIAGSDRNIVDFLIKRAF